MRIGIEFADANQSSERGSCPTFSVTSGTRGSSEPGSDAVLGLKPVSPISATMRRPTRSVRSFVRGSRCNAGWSRKPWSFRGASGSIDKREAQLRDVRSLTEMSDRWQASGDRKSATGRRPCSDASGGSCRAAWGTFLAKPLRVCSDGLMAIGNVPVAVRQGVSGVKYSRVDRSQLAWCWLGADTKPASSSGPISHSLSSGEG